MKLVRAWSHRTGQPSDVIHTDLRRTCGGPLLPRTCGGPPSPRAPADQIRNRIATIRRWALSSR